MAKGDVLNEDWIISIVLNSTERNWYADDRFEIEARKKVRKDRILRILLRIEETEEELVVIDSHLED